MSLKDSLIAQAAANIQQFFRVRSIRHQSTKHQVLSVSYGIHLYLFKPKLLMPSHGYNANIKLCLRINVLEVYQLLRNRVKSIFLMPKVDNQGVSINLRDINGWKKLIDANGDNLSMSVEHFLCLETMKSSQYTQTPCVDQRSVNFRTDGSMQKYFPIFFKLLEFFSSILVNVAKCVLFFMTGIWYIFLEFLCTYQTWMKSYSNVPVERGNLVVDMHNCRDVYEVAFISSTATGRLIVGLSAKRDFQKATWEPGGKCSFILFNNGEKLVVNTSYLEFLGKSPKILYGCRTEFTAVDILLPQRLVVFNTFHYYNDERLKVTRAGQIFCSFVIQLTNSAGDLKGVLIVVGGQFEKRLLEPLRNVSFRSSYWCCLLSKTLFVGSGKIKS